MRNRVSNPRTLRKLEALVGKPVAVVLTRGNTHHRFDIACRDGSVYKYYPTRGGALDLTADRYDLELGAIMVAPHAR